MSVRRRAVTGEMLQAGSQPLLSVRRYDGFYELARYFRALSERTVVYEIVFIG